MGARGCLSPFCQNWSFVPRVFLPDCFPTAPEPALLNKVCGSARSLPTVPWCPRPVWGGQAPRAGQDAAGRDHASASRVTLLSLSCRSVVPTWAAPRRARCRRLLGPCLLRPKPAFAPAWSVGPLAECARGRGARRGGGSNPADSCAGVLTAVSFPPRRERGGLSAPRLSQAVRGGRNAWVAGCCTHWAPDAHQFLPNVGCYSVSVWFGR